MKKFVVASAMALAVITASSVAQAKHYSGPQGFQNQAPSTVAGVLQNAYDDQIVTLQGRLTAYLGHDRYTFQDNTGSIEVELDDDRNWSYISKDEYIQIVGKVDKDFWSTTLDVKRAVSLEKGGANAPARQPNAVPGF